MIEIYEFLVKNWNKMMLILAGLLITAVIITIMLPSGQNAAVSGKKFESEDDLRIGAFTAATMFKITFNG